MFKRYLTVFTFSLLFFQGQSQTFFTAQKGQESQIAESFSITEGNFQVFDTDESGIIKHLKNAPMLGSKSSSIEITLPSPDGQESFTVYESPCMMEKISAKYPMIKSYKLISTDNPNRNGRIATGKYGIRGVFMTSKGTVYFDPIDEYNSDVYAFYYASDQKANYHGEFSCGFTSDEADQLLEEVHQKEITKNSQAKAGGAPIEFRTYRMAIACTGDYGEDRTDGTIEDALSKLNTSVSRLNQIFENELSIHINLINENDKIIWFNELTDPYPNGNSGFTLLQTNTSVINANIGPNKYDWGHCYTSGCNDVGGVANRLLICDNDGKANGITCHSNGNINAITVSIAAHEMGHQMGANHSFNNCGGNENFGTGFEPGSGSTIMSYAGLCGSNNIQGDNDDYYHSGSIDEIYNFMWDGFGSTCANKEDRGNHNPDVQLDYEDGFYIPILTPFELTGDATDPDGDNLTFAWEQRDSSLSQSVLGEPELNSPLFRVYYPDDKKTRYFPSLSRILNNTNSKTEVLPSYSRKMNFVLIARDNKFNGGGTDKEYVRFNATDKAGPFIVQSQNNFESYEVGQKVLVEWDVAGTDQDPVNASTVTIYLSTNGGQDFDHTVVELTANDGQEEIFIPNAVSSQCRIKIKAGNNIFFDINDFNFTITPATTPSFAVTVPVTYYEHCAPDMLEIPISSASILGFESNINLEINNLPTTVAASFTSNPITTEAQTNLLLDFSDVLLDETFTIEVMAVSETMDTVRRDVKIVATANDFSALETTTPIQGATGLPETPYFEWVGSINADTYNFQLSTSPDFTEGNTLTLTDLDTESVNLSNLLEKRTIYYWRIQPVNECGPGPYSDISAFSTLILACFDYEATDLPKNISQSGLPQVESTIFVPEQLMVADVNVTKLQGLHEDTGDLKFTLISPEETEIKLATNKCNFRADFNCGFDDESANSISCPLNQNRVYVPEQSLDVFKGELAEGVWTLRLKDDTAGAGGQFNEFRLSICGGVAASAPYLINNRDLGVPIGQKDRITTDRLLSADDNNTEAELTYTLVKIPVHGFVTRNDDALSIGDQFTQADISNGIMRYEHNGNDATEDGFDFTVIDGEGGWIEITHFTVLIGEGFVSGTSEELLEENQFTVYPVPATDRLFIYQEAAGEYSIELYDQNGRLLRQLNSNQKQETLNIRDLNTGNYILKLSSEEGIQVAKILKM